MQMTCQNCVEDVKRSLQGQIGIKGVFVNLEDEVVLVRSVLPSCQVQGLLESTGKLVVFRGYGGASHQVSAPEHHGAAVAIMKGGGSLIGLARLVQATPTHCLIEGTIDGLIPNLKHMLKIHEFGDLSQGCESCGDVFRIPGGPSPSGKPDGNLGSLVSDNCGRATFKLSSSELKVWDLIGRSMVVHIPTDSDSEDTQRVMCGIVARSAGLFQNAKKICTCDGVTIWEEAEKNKKLSSQTTVANSSRL